METIIYENSVRARYLVNSLMQRETLSRYKRVYILPIPSSRDGTKIMGTEITLESFADSVGDGDLVVGYGLSDELCRRMISSGARIVDSLRDEEFLLENARLTAEAALGILLSLGERSLSDMRVGIVGYGRIGKALLPMLLYHGGGASVYTGRESVRLQLSSLGISALDYKEASSRDVDIFVNTAPSDVLCRSLACQGESRITVIELASGDNFRGGASAGLEVRKYPYLPSRMFPMSAGEAWARSVRRILSESALEEE